MSPEPAVTPLRVTLADDHPPTRAGVRRALESAGWIVCAEAGDTEGAIAAALEHRPDVALLDIHMPGGGGVVAAEQIGTALPETSIVMLTVSRNDGDLFAALRAGAAGYLLKDIDPDRLTHALEGVLRGEAALPRNLVARLMEEFRGRGRRLTLPNRRAVTLTSREWEVLELMGQGMKTSEIAERIQVSAVTVRTHVSAILRKLQVPDRAAAVKLLADR